jgi:hypothetical protein
MAWRLDLHPWQMEDLTPPELEAYVDLAKKLLKNPPLG